MMNKILGIAAALAATFAIGTTSAVALDIDLEDFPDPYRSANSLGRGLTGIATADYEDALFQNPAGLGLYERAPLAKGVFTRFRTFEENINGKADDEGVYKRLILASPMVESSSALTSAYKNHAGQTNPNLVDITREVLGKNLHLGVNNFSGLVLRNMGVGAFGSARADAMVAKDPDFGGLESVKARVDVFHGVAGGAGFAVVPGSVFVGGVMRVQSRGKAFITVSPTESLDGVRESLKDNDAIAQGRGTAFDAGLMVRSGAKTLRGSKVKWHGGLQARDIGGTKMEGKGEGLSIRQTINGGMAVDALRGRTFVRLLCDVRDIFGAYEDVPLYQRLHAGGELWMSPNVGIQAGSIDGHLATGAFLDFTLLRLDGGVYTEEMGHKYGARPDRRMYARLTLGF